MNRVSHSRSFSYSRGFTLIELTVIVFILLLVSAAVVPNVVSLGLSRDLKNREGKLARLPAEARLEAARTGKPVRLRVEDTDLVMEAVPANGTGKAQRIKQVNFGKSIQADTVQLNGQPSDTGSWQWTVYPDGSAENGGIEFAEGKVLKSLLLSSDSEARWISGGLPEQAPDHWPAGRLHQRG
jgi:type II secretory pathway pseudopilin PulG